MAPGCLQDFRKGKLLPVHLGSGSNPRPVQWLLYSAGNPTWGLRKSCARDYITMLQETIGHGCQRVSPKT